MQRDIVVRDASDGRELYREGPYNAVTVRRPLEGILEELGNSGLDQFLRKRNLEQSRIGPISEATGSPSSSELSKQSIGYWWKSLRDLLSGHRSD